MGHKNESIFPKHIDVHSAANIQFTSGTTGLPKAATLSHFNIINNGFLIG
jgi:fatty-acyl-CoA synthase